MDHDWNAITTEYYKRERWYNILLSRLQNLIPTVLSNAEVDILGVFGRVKQIDSFKEKIARKEYDDPFEQAEDICGLRVIYYAKSDLESIITAIEGSGLKIIRREDKRRSLSINAFGYGAYHLIAVFPELWAQDDLAPLRDLKAEIQIASVTEHLWARLSHETEYKLEALNEDNKRRLYRLPGILEIFDDYAEMIVKSAPKQKKSELTVEQLRLFLNSAFPARDRIEERDIHFLLQNVMNYVKTKDELEEYWNKWKTVFPQIEQETYAAIGQSGKWREDGALRTLLELSNDKYWNEYRTYIPEQWKTILVRWRRKKL